MATMKQIEQGLKSERVQEENALVVAGEPFRISLKAERVQQPSALAAGPGTQPAVVELNLQLSAQQPVTIAFTEQGTIISL